MDVTAKIDRGNDIENIKNQLVVKHSLDIQNFRLIIMCIYFVEIM